MRISALVFLLVISNSPCIAATCPVPMQSSPTDVANALSISKLADLMKCDPADPSNDQSPCNTFASKGIEQIYGYSDFKTDGLYLDANHIADFVAASNRWVNTGPVFDADNNACAQALANLGYPVIAVLKDSSNNHGHIALVLPGDLAQSGTWHMLVANSASFFLDKPLKGYINDMLSKAFSPANAVPAKFFYRKLDGQP